MKTRFAFQRRALLITSALGLQAEGVKSCFCEEQIAFSPKEFRKFPIKKITSVSPDTKKYEIAFPSDEHVMGMKTSSLIMVKGPESEKEISRPYTPITLNDHTGSFELLVKKYPNGVVSSYLDSLKVGDMIEVKGPYPKLEYKPNMKKSIGFLCGGTGITPCLQVIKEVLSNPDDKTELFLMFSNREEIDVLLKAEIDALAAAHADQLEVTYLLSKNALDAPIQRHRHLRNKMILGRIHLQAIETHMPDPSPDTLIYVCGPPGFMKNVSGDKGKNFTQGPVDGYLLKAGYTEDMVYKF